MRVDPHEDTESLSLTAGTIPRFSGCMRVDPHEDTERFERWGLTQEMLSRLHEGRSARGY